MSQSPSAHNEPVRWWGTWPLDAGTARRWQIGPMGLRVERLEGEWRIGLERGTDPLSTELEVAQPEAIAEAPVGAEPAARFAGAGGGRIRLCPATPDRTIVTRPQAAFHLVGRGDVVLYVSTPLWCRIEVADDGMLIEEVPIHRPSDTWLGTSTIAGEKAYATVTHCRTDLAALPRRPHRAVTRVLVRNRCSTPLRLERLSVPIPYLALYDGGGTLWTQSISLTRDEDENGLANLEIDDGPPEGSAASGEPVAAARLEAGDGLLVRAFGALL